MNFTKAKCYRSFLGGSMILIALLLLIHSAVAGSPEGVTLTISGGALGEEQIQMIEQENHFQVKVVDRFAYNDEMLVQQLLSNDQTVDVYCVDGAFTSMSYVIDKRFALPLVNDSITRTVNRMYPSIREAVTKEGTIYAFPIFINSELDCIGYKYDVFEKAKPFLGEQPQSYSEFLDQLIHWDMVLLDEGIYPIDLYRDEWILLTLKQYCNYVAGQKQDLLFDTEVFVSIMEKTLEASTRLDTYPRTDSATYLYRFGIPSIFTDIANDFKPLALALIPGGTPMQSIHLSLLFVNPHTRYPNEATKYIASYYQSLSDIDKMMLSPNGNRPIEDPNYAESMRLIQQLLGEAEQRLASETDEAQRNSEKQIISHYESVLENPQIEKYWVSEESILNYQNLMAASYVPHTKIFDNKAVMQIIARYADGRLSTQQFAKELDRVVGMMEAEMQ